MYKQGQSIPKCLGVITLSHALLADASPGHPKNTVVYHTRHIHVCTESECLKKVKPIVEIKKHRYIG